MKIPFLSFTAMNRQVKAGILKSFEQFFDNTGYILGENVRSFEKEYAAFNETEFAVGVSNGLDALTLSLKALGIGVGDEVIVPSNTYIATVLAISYSGARPVLTEPDPVTYNIDPVNILKAITPATKMILPVHLYGQACDMTSIMKIAHDNDLVVVEDNAQAQGAKHKGKPTGSFGKVNATSFYPGKNLGALGDAGAVTTDDKKLAEKIMMLRNYGSAVKYYNEEQGFNMRLDECQAGFLSVKLPFLEQWTAERQEIAKQYNLLLKDIGDIILPKTSEHSTHVYHLYVIRTKKRDALQEWLHENGVGTLIHYPVPVHLQRAYADLGYTKGNFPIAEEIANTALSLPIWPGMTTEEIHSVCNLITLFFKSQ